MGCYVTVINLLPQKVLTPNKAVHNHYLKLTDKHSYEFQNFVLFLRENGLFDM